MIDKHGNKIVPTGHKLTLVSIRRNGKLHSFFVNLPIYKDEKVRIPSCQLNDIARGAVMAGMQEIVAALPIQQMIIDLFSGVEVNLPE